MRPGVPDDTLGLGLANERRRGCVSGVAKVRGAGRASVHGAARARMRSSAVRFFRARASTSGMSSSGVGYWNTRQVSATTNARVKPTIHLSKRRLALISVMSVSWRATDIAASRALVSSAPALTRAS